jgi:hypothetical protein
MAKGWPGLTASVASGEMSFGDGTAPLWMADGETVASGHASVEALLADWAEDPCWQPGHG